METKKFCHTPSIYCDCGSPVSYDYETVSECLGGTLPTTFSCWNAMCDSFGVKYRVYGIQAERVEG
jgi:hypothetical protein